MEWTCDWPQHTLPGWRSSDVAAAHLMPARITSVMAGLREDIEGAKHVPLVVCGDTSTQSQDAVLLADIVE